MADDHIAHQFDEFTARLDRLDRTAEAGVLQRSRVIQAHLTAVLQADPQCSNSAAAHALIELFVNVTVTARCNGYSVSAALEMLAQARDTITAADAELRPAGANC
jgi:hypothetical protein